MNINAQLKKYLKYILNFYDKACVLFKDLTQAPYFTRGPIQIKNETNEKKCHISYIILLLCRWKNYLRLRVCPKLKNVRQHELEEYLLKVYGYKLLNVPCLLFPLKNNKKYTLFNTFIN